MYKRKVLFKHHEKWKKHCNICKEVLKSHLYKNICGEHLPSYSVWTNEECNCGLLIREHADNILCRKCFNCVISNCRCNEINEIYEINDEIETSEYEDEGFEESFY